MPHAESFLPAGPFDPEDFSNGLLSWAGACLAERADLAAALDALPALAASGVADGTLDALAPRLSKDHMVRRLRRELQGEDSFELIRQRFDADVFASWVPRGLLVHVLREDALVPGLLELCDSFVTGNASVALYPAPLAPLAPVIEALGGRLPTARLRSIPLDALPEAALALLGEQADAVVVHADEDARLWKARAAEVIDCAPGAEALYVSASRVAAEATAGQVAAWRARPRTARGSLLFLETAGGPSPGSWAAEATPLPRTGIAAHLRRARVPVRTATLLCDPADLPELARSFFAAGASHVEHLDAASGDLPEPLGPPRPDGLRRYVRRASLEGDGSLRGITRLFQLAPRPPAAPRDAAVPVATKEIFTSGVERYGEVFLTTGGSTGEPALASYTYESFSIHTRAGGEAMYAAGLDPLRDRVMNLFTAGGLYSGFLGFFKALETLSVPQFPMASLPNLELVSRAIVEHRVNVLVGLPPYILQLFKAYDALFAEYRGVEKIFYSGDHFDPGQAQYLKDRYGVKVILSGHYGSIDAGSFGFQCADCEGTVLHLHDHLQDLEILDTEADRPVSPGEVGRLIFSSRVHSPESLQRYDTGDLGRWVEGVCRCGRATPRFELLGRLSDWFKAGTFFMNYWRIVNGVRRETGYIGNTQVRLTSEHGRDCITVSLAADGPFDAESARAAVLHSYPELADKVLVRQVFDLAVELIPDESFIRSRTSGKIRHVVDQRRVIPGFEY